MCDSDVTTEEDVPETARPVTVIGTLLLSHHMCLLTLL